MKKIKKLNTKFFTRGYSMAKILAVFAKDLYFTPKKELGNKLAELLTERRGQLTDELSQLKGSFLKAGQLLSLYAQDLLPPEVENLFQKLQTETSYLPWESISQQLDLAQLQGLTIDPTPFAAASIGQVHLAKDEQGQEFALKIQYKGIDKVIDLDLKVLKIMIQSLSLVPKSTNLEKVFDEVKQMLYQEMDYLKEAEFSRSFYQLAGEDYIVPKVIDQWSGERFICTEYIPGEKVVEASQHLSEKQRAKLGRDFFELFFKEVFVWKLIQSDAHLGNFMIHQGKWVLLDFGATKQLGEKESTLYKELVQAIAVRDKVKLYEIIRAQGALDFENSDLELFWDYILLVSTPFFEKDYDWGNSDIAKKAINMSRDLQQKINLKHLPHETLFIDRKLLGVYYILKAIGAKGDLIPREYFEMR
jgi:predicted unusual protein kinase regulating ubiquinone biosynthesis (AarF/ABC1/UbiB family)